VCRHALNTYLPCVLTIHTLDFRFKGVVRLNSKAILHGRSYPIYVSALAGCAGDGPGWWAVSEAADGVDAGAFLAKGAGDTNNLLSNEEVFSVGAWLEGDVGCAGEDMCG
jgi:hypothetical protein